MKIELHLLQNFAPSNLNRDDTGAPKDCDLGGHRRARISSQCQKRSVREAFRLAGLLPIDDLGARTTRLVHQVANELASTYGMARDDGAALALGAIEGVGLGRKEKGEGEDGWKTKYLLFVPRRIVKALAALLHEHLEVLKKQEGPAATAVQPVGGGENKKAPTKKEAKNAAKRAYPKEVRDGVEALLQSARATPDLALFGRMIADKPEWNVEASCQVAHAISTNRVQMDFDFFTAVDDFKPGDTAGSDMMGTVQFNSSCFYRYAVLDVDALRVNLDADGDTGVLVSRSVGAFVRAFVSAIPTGKQNSMAAHNFPSYALAVVRDRGQSISLSNAFLKPARPRGEDVDLVDDSVAKLEEYFGRMREALGDGLLVAVTWADRDLHGRDGIERSKGLSAWFDAAIEHATGMPG